MLRDEIWKIVKESNKKPETNEQDPNPKSKPGKRGKSGPSSPPGPERNQEQDQDQEQALALARRQIFKDGKEEHELNSGSQESDR